MYLQVLYCEYLFKLTELMVMVQFDIVGFAFTIIVIIISRKWKP